VITKYIFTAVCCVSVLPHGVHRVTVMTQNITLVSHKVEGAQFKCKQQHQYRVKQRPILTRYDTVFTYCSFSKKLKLIHTEI